MRRAPRTLIATLLVGLLSLSGCILGANTGGESPDTNTVSDTAVSDTGVADTGVADTGEPEDTDDTNTVSDTAVSDTEVADTGKPGDTDDGKVAAGESCQEDNDCRSGRCSDNRCAQRIFVTSSTYRGFKLGGAAGADRRCRILAKRANLAGNWLALVPGQSSRLFDRVDLVDAGTVNLGGELLAKDQDGLFDKSLQNAVRYTEKAKKLGDGNSGEVWTGLSWNGMTADDHCKFWTASSDSVGNNTTGRVGSAFIDQVDGDNNHSWLVKRNVTCTKTSRLYCIDGQQ